MRPFSCPGALISIGTFAISPMVRRVRRRCRKRPPSAWAPGTRRARWSISPTRRPPHEVAFADPAPLINPDNPNAIELGGDWSNYWYNGRIYESDITRGLIIWDLSDDAVAGAKRLPHLNPQTEEFSFPLKGSGG